MPVIINGSTGISGVDGSAGTPAFQGSDTNTGIRFGTDIVSLVTGGSDRLYIDSSGRLGVGTSSPSEKLSINEGNIKLTSSDTFHYIALSNTSTGGRQWTLANAGASDPTGVTAGTLYLRDSTAGANRVAIDSSGRLGIGSTSPGDKLTVLGDAANIRLQTSSSSSNNSIEFYETTSRRAFAKLDSSPGELQIGTVPGWATCFYTNNTERARIDSSGRLLVGTSSSASSGDGQYCRLQVQGNTSNSAGSGIIALERGEAATSITTNETLGAVLFTDSAGNSFAEITAQADNNAGAGDYPGRLLFSTTADGASSPTERMRITESGELWINRTTRDPSVSSACKFQLAGGSNEWSAAIRNTGALPYGLLIRHETDSNGIGNEFISCYGANNARFTARSNGGLANYSGNNVNLSDINSKKDISPAADTWDCIKEWEIVNYRYKDQPDDTDLNMGVIAQQVAESCPEVITVFSEATEEQPEKLGIKEQQMYWMAIKALQEAQVRIEQLEARLTAAGIE